MTYTVCGFESGILDTASLQIKLLRMKQALAPLMVEERMMYGYSVDEQGHDLLERQFKKQFANFVLLNDVAIEACQALKIPHGQEVGTIEVDVMGGLAVPLFKWAYFTEV